VHENILLGSEGSGITLNDLVSNGSLRRSGENYVVNFAWGFLMDDRARVM